MARLHMLKSLTDTINTSFLLEHENKIIIVDGGFRSEAPYMYEYIKSLGGKVDAWFLTHAHDDHVGCLLEILKQHPDVSIGGIYYSFPSEEFATRGEPVQSDMSTAELYAHLTEFSDRRSVPRVTVFSGDVFNFSGLTVRVLRTPNEQITRNPINNSSVVYRLETNGSSLLFLGDLGVEGGAELLSNTPPSLLRADYVQMAHHGQGGVDKNVYEAIRPSYTFWCTPSWLWDNMGDRGYDTGVFKTVIVRGWMSSLGSVKRHYLMTEGTHIIDL